MEHMEALNILEEKIAVLIQTVQKLKEENADLSAENVRLSEALFSAKQSVESNDKDIERISEEKHQARVMIDDLIKSVDRIIASMN